MQVSFGVCCVYMYLLTLTLMLILQITNNVQNELLHSHLDLREEERNNKNIVKKSTTLKFFNQ